MYEKRICFVVFIVLFIFLFSGCRTTEVVSDISDRTREHRELESEIRDGETELAITSERISEDAKDIRETNSDIERTNNELREQLNKLEQSITESNTNEQEIEEILQRVRNRELTENQLIELGIELN